MVVKRQIGILSQKFWSQHPTVICCLSLLWWLGTSGLAFLWQLGNVGLIDETEPLFAEAARQMTVTGDWITPYFNDDTRFDKPPLVYWLMAIAYRIFGVNEWAARLPSALVALALTGFVFYTLRCFGIPYSLRCKVKPHFSIQEHRALTLSAWLGAAMLALNPEIIIWARTGVSDMLLTGCLGGALLCFFQGYARSGNGKIQGHWYLAFYVLAALAVLAKGPIGIVLPGLIIGIFLLYLGNWRSVLREMKLLRGGLLFLVLILPWYLLIIWTHGEDYIESFFGYHNLERFTAVVNHHAAPWYFYFIVVLLGFAPWSTYLPLAIARWQVWRRRYWQQQPRAAHFGLFAVFWFGSIFLFFTIAATKLPSYVLPLMPAAAILVALLWSEVIDSNQNRQESLQDLSRIQARGLGQDVALSVSGGLNAGLLLIIAGACLLAPEWLGKDPAMPYFAEALQSSGLLGRGAVIGGGTGAIAILLLLRRQFRWLWSANLVGFILLLSLVLLPGYQLYDAQRQLPIRQLAEQITQVRQPDEKLVMIGFEKPSMVFYTQRPVKYRYNSRSTRKYLQRWTSHQPDSPTVLIVGYPDKIEGLNLPPTQYQRLGAAGPYQLVRVSWAPSKSP